MLESLLAASAESNGHSVLEQEIKRRIEDLRALPSKRAVRLRPAFPAPNLSMGHSQFAEFIGAAGPTPKSTLPARAPRKRCRWRKTGFTPDGAAG